MLICVFSANFVYWVFYDYLGDCEQDDKSDFEYEQELMQELKRHENVIQLLGICKGMYYHLHCFIFRINSPEEFLKIVPSLFQAYSFIKMWLAGILLRYLRNF